MDARFFTHGTFAPVAVLKQADAGMLAPEALQGALHDPTLEPRDEAVFLLTAAAEIEHALMVQYLYAAYSVRVTGAQSAALQRVQDLLTQIAREEMGHLATVENLLQLIGGPVNLGREHSPYASAVYPFRFMLEPVTLGSLAKYVTAESPMVLPDSLSEADRALVLQLHDDATPANGGQQVRHVGPIFERLAELFGDPVDGLSDDDFRPDSGPRHATFADWGFTARNPAAGQPLIIESFPGSDVAALRTAATAAVRAIAAQGEGFDPEPAGSGTESHFERFFDVYQRVSALLSAGTAVTWPVATNPNTTPAPTTPAVDAVEAAVEEHASDGRITEPRARAWAQLFNLRYRLLLAQLAHFLRLDQELYRSAPGPGQGDRTARGLLLIGTFDEMRHLSKIAAKLVQLPKDDAPGGLHTGPTFELPYTLNLPDGEPARWRTHLDASRAAARLISTQLDPDADPFLTDLLVRDAAAQVRMGALAAGAAVPEGSLPSGFAKAVTILEEAVRGFTIGRHRNFWSGATRDEFVSAPVSGDTPVALDATGAVIPDPAQAALVQRLTAPVEDRMPRFRPSVPAARISYLEQWISDGCPDDDPPGRVGVHHEPDPAAEPPAQL